MFGFGKRKGNEMFTASKVLADIIGDATAGLQSGTDDGARAALDKIAAHPAIAPVDRHDGRFTLDEIVGHIYAMQGDAPSYTPPPPDTPVSEFTDDPDITPIREVLPRTVDNEGKPLDPKVFNYQRAECGCTADTFPCGWGKKKCQYGCDYPTSNPVCKVCHHVFGVLAPEAAAANG